MFYSGTIGSVPHSGGFWTWPYRGAAVATKKAARKTRKVTTKAKRKRVPGKPGRPRVEIDTEALERLVNAGCIMDEIADIMGISRATLQARAADTEEVGEVLRKGRATRKRNLRLAQTRRALQGDTRMLIHLGEQELGQRLIKAVEISGLGGAPIEIDAGLQPVLEEKLAAFLKAREIDLEDEAE